MQRVQRGHGLLENHGNAIATNMPELFLRQRQQILAGIDDAARGMAGQGVWQQAQNRMRGHRFARAAFANQRQVIRTLEKQLERDHAKTNIIGITELGLVQMTRKRTRESLEQVLCEPCVCCQGRGKLKTPETICYEIFREILREARAYQATGYRVLANQKVVDRLLDEESGNVAELEGFIGRTIRFQVETMYSQEQYDVVLL